MRLAVPTLLLHGADDRIVPVDVALMAKATLLDAELVVFPGTGHVPTVRDTRLWRRRPWRWCSAASVRCTKPVGSTEGIWEPNETSTPTTPHSCDTPPGVVRRDAKRPRLQTHLPRCGRRPLPTHVSSRRCKAFAALHPRFGGEPIWLGRGRNTVIGNEEWDVVLLGPGELLERIALAFVGSISGFVATAGLGRFVVLSATLLRRIPTSEIKVCISSARETNRSSETRSGNFGGIASRHVLKRHSQRQ
jgi:hypothetical protein